MRVVHNPFTGRLTTLSSFSFGLRRDGGDTLAPRFASLLYYGTFIEQRIQIQQKQGVTFDYDFTSLCELKRVRSAKVLGNHRQRKVALDAFNFQDSDFACPLRRNECGHCILGRHFLYFNRFHQPNQAPNVNRGQSGFEVFFPMICGSQNRHNFANVIEGEVNHLYHCSKSLCRLFTRSFSSMRRLPRGNANRKYERDNRTHGLNPRCRTWVQLDPSEEMPHA